MYLLKTYDDSGIMDFEEVFDDYGEAVASAIGASSYEINKVG